MPRALTSLRRRFALPLVLPPPAGASPAALYRVAIPFLYRPAELPASQIVRDLRKTHKVEIALREGRLRASPHFYNRDEQIDRLLEYLPRH